MAESQSRSDLYVVLALLACSLGFNVYQGNRMAQLTSTQDPVPRIGTTISDISVVDLDGKKSTLSFAGQPVPTVVYIFTPPCHWCARNWNNVRAVVQQSGRSFRFVGLSLQRDGLRDYVAKNRVPFPVFTDIPPQARQLLRLGSTPEMFVVSPDGKLTNVWVGAFSGANAEALETFFHSPLPGLSADAPAAAATDAGKPASR